MKVYDNPLYIEDVKYIANLNLPWIELSNKTIMISGATGLIGSMLIDVLMEKNNHGLICFYRIQQQAMACCCCIYVNVLLPKAYLQLVSNWLHKLYIYYIND